MWYNAILYKAPQIAKCMGPTFGPAGSCRPQMGPMLTPWILLSGTVMTKDVHGPELKLTEIPHTLPSWVLQWRHNDGNGGSYNQSRDCLLNRLFRRRSKLRVTGLCEGNSPATGEFPVQKASNAENSIWWRHHGWAMKCLLWGLWRTSPIL